jgi:hypothetical protein
MQANHIWSLWQELLCPFRWAFTEPGWHRFGEWVTGLALNLEEHTITQSLIGLDRAQDWKALETFAESGSWDDAWIERDLARLVETAPGRLWWGYHIDAVDDTKTHRSSANVWGTCTFHEYTARCPNRAGTVRAHNWVVVGALLENGEQPAWFLPLAGRLYFRKSQLPLEHGDHGARESFHTKCDLAVDLLRQQARSVGGQHLAVFDGAYALRSVVRPLVQPEDEWPRLDFLTRLRQDARLYRLPPTQREPGRPGRQRRWGTRLPAPRQGGRWPGKWQSGEAFVYGRVRRVRWKEVICLWSVAGHEIPVKAVVAKVEGYRKRFTLVSSATALTGLQLLSLFAARFRQEDGFRDLKQRLGWEECRAWTKKPIVRTTEALFVTMTLLRLLQFRLQEEQGDGWWLQPPWNRRKLRPSVLDVERLLRQHRGQIQQLLSGWLGDEENDASAQLQRRAM